MFRRFFIAIPLLLLNACALPGARAPAGLPPTVVTMLNLADIPAAAMGAVAIRLSDGAAILSHQADASLQPASTLKLVTSIVGLERLGPAYRGRTELRTTGEVIDGVLHGDLVMRGRGDPDLDWEAFRRMLQTLRNKGISAVEGDLVLDRQWFLPARADLGRDAFDETPEFRYNVIPDALLLNTNLLQLDMQSAMRGNAPVLKVSMTPAMDRVMVVSKMTFVDRPCDSWEDGWSLPTVSVGEDKFIRILLEGEFPYQCAATTEINVLDRVDFADRLFRRLWWEVGGTFSGRTRDSTIADTSSTETRLLTQHRSRPLAEFVRDIDKHSDNPIARLLYLSLGALSASDGGADTALRAEREVRAWFKEQGIDDEGLVLENGSGLSRIERIRPSQLAAVLKAAYRSDWAPEFLASLPIIALDGGMRNRLRNSPAAGRARIKTGTLRDVSAVAGFVPDASGQLCIVVAMINHPLAKDKTARPILDALLDWVAHSARQTQP